MVSSELRRVSDSTEMKEIQGGRGYVLNVRGSKACIHLANCVTVRWMNPDKRGGVYHAPTLGEALEWAEGESIECSPCKICLPSLTYRPRPEKLTEHI